MSADFDAARVDEFIARYGKDPSSLIQVLQDIQGEYRYLPKAAMLYVSKELNVPVAQTYNVATFYNAFSLNPIGKRHICVCMGTACHVRGSSMVLDSLSERLGLKPGQTSADGEYTLDTVNCLGACSLAPVVVINDEVHAKQNAAVVQKLVSKDGKKAKAAKEAAGSKETTKNRN
jgi:NADH:ubiquinone oxidoreductase subunit E